MKTLGKEVTKRFFKTPEDYDRLVSSWSQKVNNKTDRICLNCPDHTLYLILRGKDWRKGFSFLGRTSDRVLKHIEFSLRTKTLSPVFKNVISEEAYTLIPQLIHIREGYND